VDLVKRLEAIVGQIGDLLCDAVASLYTAGARDRRPARWVVDQRQREKGPPPPSWRSLRRRSGTTAAGLLRRCRSTALLLIIAAAAAAATRLAALTATPTTLVGLVAK